MVADGYVSTVGVGSGGLLVRREITEQHLHSLSCSIFRLPLSLALGGLDVWAGVYQALILPSYCV
jgi:hypothetical protein